MSKKVASKSGLALTVAAILLTTMVMRDCGWKGCRGNSNATSYFSPHAIG